MIEQQRRVPLSGWQGAVPPPPSEPPKKKKVWGVGAVVAVQSIACVVVLLLALLLRTAGGEPYARLRESFWDSLQRNDLLATLAALWDGDPSDSVSSELQELNDHAPPTDSDTTTTTTTTATTTATTSAATAAPTATGTAGDTLPAGVVAVPLRVNHIPVPPLTAGTVTSGYGYRENPTGEGMQFHRGVDIAAPEGTPLFAMFGGRVTAVGESPSLGNYVRLEHGDGVEVLYAHCAAVLVTQDAVLRAGETVALVGATGDVTGAHVHIEVHGDGLVYAPHRIVPVARYA